MDLIEKTYFIIFSILLVIVSASCHSRINSSNRSPLSLGYAELPSYRIYSSDNKSLIYVKKRQAINDSTFEEITLVLDTLRMESRLERIRDTFRIDGNYRWKKKGNGTWQDFFSPSDLLEKRVIKYSRIEGSLKNPFIVEYFYKPLRNKDSGDISTILYEANVLVSGADNHELTLVEFNAKIGFIRIYGLSPLTDLRLVNTLGEDEFYKKKLFRKLELLW